MSDTSFFKIIFCINGSDQPALRAYWLWQDMYTSGAYFKFKQKPCDPTQEGDTENNSCLQWLHITLQIDIHISCKAYPIQINPTASFDNAIQLLQHQRLHFLLDFLKNTNQGCCNVFCKHKLTISAILPASCFFGRLLAVRTGNKLVQLKPSLYITGK